ncbi:hypothetical protein [Allosphingosinicella vermicomposti]|uniref:hypothetical protein n=1 Tax=Allosphingosinicella vermicomposti TaxID=614671 RepID=UPI001A9C6979|nr:hypothetical protein [Allosphingosinicella vermicomposti]
MGIFGKAMSGVMAAALLAGAAAAPAEARGRWGNHHHRNDKLTAGDVIGGLLLIGGIAAIASAAKSDSGDDYGYGYGYDSRDRAKRDAVYTCTNEAERGAGYDDARVRDITDVDRRDGVYRVRGVVDLGNVDSGSGIKSFTCFAKNGEIYNFELNDYRF